MRTRIRDGEDHSRTTTGGRFAREPGTLAPTLGGGAQQRCSCQRCGAHLLAIAVGADRYEGVCLVCGGDRITPV